MLHAGVWLLVGVFGTGIWWIAERSQGMDTAFWPGLLMLLLLIPLALHAAVVYMAGPGRQPPAGQPSAGPSLSPAPEAGERALATVVFTDICGSTERAAALGDRDWKSLLGRHDEVLRDVLARHGGVEVHTTGDGMLATFDSPTRAVHCASDMIDATQAIGLAIRAGVHTGEIERHGKDLAGIAVHIGARVAALAGEREVLVSGTVPPLVVGSGLDFADRGDHELKGVPGTWHLFALKG